MKQTELFSQKNHECKNKIKERWLVVGDTHCPEEDSLAVKCMLAVGRAYKPTHLLHLGDVGEFTSISPWNRNKPKLLEGCRLQDDIEDAVDFLKLFGRVSPLAKKIVLLGNHEERVNWFLESNPTVEGLVSIEKSYSSVGWKVIDLNKPFEITPKLIAVHGITWSKFAAAAHLTLFSKNVIFGHIHKSQSYTHSFYDGTKEAWACPCLSDLNPSYLRNKPSAFNHGFMTIDVFQNGNFSLNTHQIFNGRVGIFGRVFSGN